METSSSPSINMNVLYDSKEALNYVGYKIIPKNINDELPDAIICAINLIDHMVILNVNNETTLFEVDLNYIIDNYNMIENNTMCRIEFGKIMVLDNENHEKYVMVTEGFKYNYDDEEDDDIVLESEEKVFKHL